VEGKGKDRKILEKRRERKSVEIKERETDSLNNSAALFATCHALH
jgi:hypothetical protein